MTCSQVRPHLEALADGELDPGRARELRAHLLSCPSCTADYRLAVSLPGRLQALRSPAPPAGLVTGVLRAVGRRPPLLAWGLLAPEILLALLIAWYLSFAGIANLAGSTWGDVSSAWTTGFSSLPQPPAVDLFLVLCFLALVALAALQLALFTRGFAAPGGRRRA
ncbi:MAG TPA: zf-HC2 domain-containing protein [Candidatus Acidoferrales bacterium]|nr:zf-HC2 domain-containing protein [Candidatus Acidoferrales bacterium]